MKIFYWNLFLILLRNLRKTGSTFKRFFFSKRYSNQNIFWKTLMLMRGKWASKWEKANNIACEWTWVRIHLKASTTSPKKRTMHFRWAWANPNMFRFIDSFKFTSMICRRRRTSLQFARGSRPNRRILRRIRRYPVTHRVCRKESRCAKLDLFLEYEQVLCNPASGAIQETHMIHNKGIQDVFYTEENWSSVIKSYITNAPPKFKQVGYFFL